MNCTVGKDDFPIPGFRRCQFSIRKCFAMTIKKAQKQSISGTLGINLREKCFSHGKLYVALSRTTNIRNVFICTTNGSSRTKNVVFLEVFSTRDKCISDEKSVTAKNPKDQAGKDNRHSISYLLNPELSPCIPNPIICDDDAISLSENESAMSNSLKENESASKSTRVLEFESIYGSILERMRCAGITFNKQDFATVITPKS